MLLQNLFIRPKTPPPRFAPGLFLGLLVVFVLLGQTKPIVGLAGIGTVLIIAAVMIEINRQRIWDDYKKSYRKQAGKSALWTKPNHLYYTINVAVLWPVVLLLGAVCLYAAYMLG